ncbi:serine hydrolase domain-containing protein [Luedemannella flava]|uniref:Serine hydrolase domain-containing protein n=1 Tax=Luedemannella flava TaxID=349316 RepID=A0ABN2LLC1_9ACTN
MTLQSQTVHRVDDLVAGAQSEGRVPSLVAGVVRDGVLEHVSGAGGLPTPDADTQYRIGSISKSMTAALLLRLRDDGKLGLEEPLDRHLPGTALGRVTLRQLLAHAGGAQREPDGAWWERSVGGDLQSLVAGTGPEKAAWPPLRRYHYSNLAYGLLGGVAAKVAGTDWWSAVRERLLEPLGMPRTTYQATQPFARGYVVHPWHGTLREEPRHDAGAMAPAGQLWSTVTDLARWAAFLAGPDPEVLAPATVREMASPVVLGDPERWTAGYGLGLQLWRRGERVYAGHSGSMPGYLAILVTHRASRTGVVAFANAYRLSMPGGIGGLGLRLLDAVLDSEPAPPARPWRPGAAPPNDVEPLCGRWWWMGQEYEAHWDSESRELVLRSLGPTPMVPWRFAPLGADRWRCRSGENDGEYLKVHRGRAGTVAALDIATWVFTRDPWPAM